MNSNIAIVNIWLLLWFWPWYCIWQFYQNARLKYCTCSTFMVCSTSEFVDTKDIITLHRVRMCWRLLNLCFYMRFKLRRNKMAVYDYWYVLFFIVQCILLKLQLTIMRSVSALVCACSLPCNYLVELAKVAEWGATKAYTDWRFQGAQPP